MTEGTGSLYTPASEQHVLVTGAAGFIGARVSELLLARGTHVTGVDNLVTTYDPRLKQWRLDRLRQQSNFTFCEQDICDRAGIHSLIANAPKPIDAIINLAARAGVAPSVTNPYVYFETNLTGTLNLLEACRAFGIQKFVLASTSSVYGKDNVMPFGEDADTSKPLSPYAASKKAAEVLCHAYHYLHPLDITVVRYFTVYGPAGRPDMSLFRFVQRINEGLPITVYGDGTQSRDFTFIDDIARGTIAACQPLGFAILNLGSNQPLVLNSAIRIIEELTRKNAVIEYQPRQEADIPASWADIRRADLVLQWRPQMQYQQGLEKLVHWYSENRAWAKDIVTA